MPHFPIGDGRTVELPSQALVCDKYLVVAGDDQFAIAFIVDDGTTAQVAAAVSLPLELVAKFAKDVVGGAELLGLDWKNVLSRPLPPQSEQAH